MSSGIQGLCQYESAANNWVLNYTAPRPPSTSSTRQQVLPTQHFDFGAKLNLFDSFESFCPAENTNAFTNTLLATTGQFTVGFGQGCNRVLVESWHHFNTQLYLIIAKKSCTKHFCQGQNSYSNNLYISDRLDDTTFSLADYSIMPIFF